MSLIVYLYILVAIIHQGACIHFNISDLKLLLHENEEDQADNNGVFISDLIASSLPVSATRFRRSVDASSVRLVDGRLTISQGVDWDDDLLYPNTTVYSTMQEQVKRLLDVIFASSNLGHIYSGSIINNFSEGSVKVDFTVVLKDPKDNSTNTSISDIDSDFLTAAFLAALSGVESNFTLELNETHFYETNKNSSLIIPDTSTNDPSDTSQINLVQSGIVQISSDTSIQQEHAATTMTSESVTLYATLLLQSATTMASESLTDDTTLLLSSATTTASESLAHDTTFLSSDTMATSESLTHDTTLLLLSSATTTASESLTRDTTLLSSATMTVSESLTHDTTLLLSSESFTLDTTLLLSSESLTHDTTLLFPSATTTASESLTHDTTLLLSSAATTASESLTHDTTLLLSSAATTLPQQHQKP
ncbi:uro-adherence factor A-like [Gigantopelta aegis]|uniref:uro-adherence factor A-like n=1 Tax=Gigantopelta aegis TaxID=1735272 RepID=UPI001B88BFB4|nr:uro-adherence factor A-like [Gigantopelta aegis]